MPRPATVPASVATMQVHERTTVRSAGGRPFSKMAAESVAGVLRKLKLHNTCDIWALPKKLGDGHKHHARSEAPNGSVGRLWDQDRTQESQDDCLHHLDCHSIPFSTAIDGDAAIAMTAQLCLAIQSSAVAGNLLQAQPA